MKTNISKFDVNGISSLRQGEGIKTVFIGRRTTAGSRCINRRTDQRFLVSASLTVPLMLMVFSCHQLTSKKQGQKIMAILKT
ncbi:MAG: hypothetical protein R2788_24380 [Saprospiraceae bacterium]